MLEQVRAELGLVKQAVELGSKSTDNAIAVLGETIKGLALKVDAIAMAQTEPAASPAGRAMLEKIETHGAAIRDHDQKIDAFQEFQTSVTSSLRTIRLGMTVGGFILGLVSGVTAVVTFFAGHPTP